MKTKLAILILGLTACSLTVVAQENTTPPATNATEATPAATEPVAPAAPTDPAAAPQDPTAATPIPDDTTPPTFMDSVVVSTPDEEQAGAVIPMIVMDDVPLTDAIKNLARQAGLNYMLDPKITLLQPGAPGAPAAQTTVSIRWENVTAEQALTALLGNHGLQLVEDPKTKIARITVKDPAQPDPLFTRIIQLKYSSPSNVLHAVQSTLSRRSRVVGDIRTSQLVVVATEKELDAVEQLIERLDTPTKQVLIEAKLIETSMNPNTIKGIDWSGTLEAQRVAVGNNVLGGQGGRYSEEVDVNTNTGVITTTFGENNLLASPRLLMDTARGFNPNTAFLDADGLAAVISFLNKDAAAKVISSPRTVTLDNEPALISVTRASPIINVTPSSGNVAGGSQINYTNLGVILNVTPRISANNYVNLAVFPEVSRVFRTVTRVVNNGAFQADEYDIRKLETRVMIPSGHTLVLGGLVQDDVRNSNTKVPILGDMPLFGRAFRSDSKSRSQNNLLIFVTPTIVEDSDFQPTPTDFLKSSPLIIEDQEWTAWDSGKPYDWSKIMPGKKAAKEPEAPSTVNPTY